MFYGRTPRAQALLARFDQFHAPGARETSAAKAKFSLLSLVDAGDDAGNGGDGDNGDGGGVAQERKEAARWMREEALPQAAGSPEEATKILRTWFQHVKTNDAGHQDTVLIVLVRSSTRLH